MTCLQKKRKEVLFILVWIFSSAAAVSHWPHYSTKVGDFELTVISDGTMQNSSLSLTDLLVDVPKSAAQMAIDAHFLAKDLTAYYNPLYLDTGDRKLLFDTGSWNKIAPTVGKLLENMVAAGIDPDQIDNVVFTHGHVDHIAGVLKPDGALAFPNARYAIGRKEYEFWKAAVEDKTILKDWGVGDLIKFGQVMVVGSIFDAIEDKLDLFEFGDEIIPGVTSKGTIGHTPGHSSFIIRSGDESLFVSGDSLLLDYISVEHPEWRIIADFEQSKAIETRFALLEELADNGMRGSYYHFGFPGIGHIYRTSNGFAFRPARYEL